MKEDKKNVGELGEIDSFEEDEEDDSNEEDLKDVVGFEDELDEESKEEKEKSNKLRIRTDLPVTAFKIRQKKETSSPVLEQIAQGENEGDLEERLGTKIDSEDKNEIEGVEYLNPQKKDDSLYGSGPKNNSSTYTPTRTQRLSETDTVFDKGPRGIYSQEVSELSQGEQVKRERDYNPKTKIKRFDDRGTFFDKEVREYEV